MKSAVVLQQCNLTAFGEGFYCRVLQEGQCVMINFMSHLIEEKSARFSLNMVQYVFRNLDKINVPYGILCIDRRITCT